MKEIPRFGEFYGNSEQQIETDSFSFVLLDHDATGFVPVHTHDSAHFLYILDGEYESKIKGNRKHCSPLTMLYHPAGTTHRDHFKTHNGHFMTISITPIADKKIREGLNSIEYSLFFSDLEISWLGKRICNELISTDDLSPIVLDGMTNELLAYSIRRIEVPENPPRWLEMAFELLNDRFNEKIKISEIAAAVGVHPLHLARTFRAFFGCSPGEYLRKRRIAFASNLLITSKKSLADIALLSGFSDQSQFTRGFRQYAGTTPKRFREIHGS